MKTWIGTCLGAIFTGALAMGADSTEVALDKVPPAVWKTVQSATGGVNPLKVEKMVQDGEVLFHATLKSIAGNEQNMLVAQDGRMISLEVPLADVPKAARDVITARVGEGKIVMIDKRIDPDGATFDVDFVTSAALERTLSVDDGGALLSLQIGLKEAPEEVLKAVQSRIVGGKLNSIEQVNDEGQTVYDVDFTNKQGKEVSCTFAANGKLMSVDVTVEELPATVQATVSEKVGTGKVMRACKIYNAKHILVRYEIEAVVDGKAFDFSVGPKGKFLGMDS